MLNGLITRTENTVFRIPEFSLLEVIPSDELVVEQEPQEDMNSGWDQQFPNSKNVKRHHPSKTNDCIQGNR